MSVRLGCEITTMADVPVGMGFRLFNSNKFPIPAGATIHVTLKKSLAFPKSNLGQPREYTFLLTSELKADESIEQFEATLRQNVECAATATW